jgi:hypothetical protein
MKRSFLTSIVLILTTILYGQQNPIDNRDQDSLKCKSEIKISVSPTENIALYYQSVQGGPGRKFKPGFSTSFEYLFRCDKKINLGFGLCYQFAQVEYTPNMDSGDFFTGQIDNVSVISFNFTTIYKLKRDFYLTLNPMITLQLNYNPDFITDKQSGLGLSFSLGKYFNLNDNLRLNIEPKLWIHNIVPFQAENLPLRLTTCGLNLGLVFGKSSSQLPD